MRRGIIFFTLSKEVGGIGFYTCAVADFMACARAQRHKNAGLEGVLDSVGNIAGGGHGRLEHGKCAGD